MEKSHFWWFCWLGLGNPRHIATKTPLEKLDQNLGLAVPPPSVGTKTQIFPKIQFEGSPYGCSVACISWIFTTSPSVLSVYLDSWILMWYKYQQIYSKWSILFKIYLRYNSLMLFSSSLGYNSDLRRKRFKAYLYIGLDSLNNHYERLFEHLFRADILIHKCYSKCYFLCNSLLSKNI